MANIFKKKKNVDLSKFWWTQIERNQKACAVNIEIIHFFSPFSSIEKKITGSILPFLDDSLLEDLGIR